MKSLPLAVFILLTAAPASASDVPPLQRATPNLAKDAEGFPTLVGKTRAIARINRALRAANGKRLKEIQDCGRGLPPDGSWWEQSVDTPLLGARFVSFFAHGNAFCGGAHPGFIMDPLVFDLRTGKPVNWKKLLPVDLFDKPDPSPADDPAPASDEIRSTKLTALFIAASENASAPECKEEFVGGKLSFVLWPDAKEKGLEIHTSSLPQAVLGVCGGPVTIPLANLKQVGLDSALIRDIETGSYQFH